MKFSYNRQSDELHIQYSVYGLNHRNRWEKLYALITSITHCLPAVSFAQGEEVCFENEMKVSFTWVTKIGNGDFQLCSKALIAILGLPSGCFGCTIAVESNSFFSDVLCFIQKELGATLSMHEVVRSLPKEHLSSLVEGNLQNNLDHETCSYLLSLNDKETRQVLVKWIVRRIESGEEGALEHVQQALKGLDLKTLIQEAHDKEDPRWFFVDLLPSIYLLNANEYTPWVEKQFEYFLKDKYVYYSEMIKPALCLLLEHLDLNQRTCLYKLLNDGGLDSPQGLCFSAVRASVRSNLLFKEMFTFAETKNAGPLLITVLCNIYSNNFFKFGHLGKLMCAPDQRAQRYNDIEQKLTEFLRQCSIDERKNCWKAAVDGVMASCRPLNETTPIVEAFCARVLVQINALLTADDKKSLFSQYPNYMGTFLTMMARYDTEGFLRLRDMLRDVLSQKTCKTTYPWSFGCAIARYLETSNETEKTLIYEKLTK